MDRRQKTWRVPVRFTFLVSSIAQGIVEVSVEDWTDVERVADTALAAVNYLTSGNGSLIMEEGEFARMVKKLKASK